MIILIYSECDLSPITNYILHSLNLLNNVFLIVCSTVFTLSVYIFHLLPIVATLFKPYGFLIPKDFKMYLALSVPDEGYSRNTMCTLNLISTADEGYSRNTLCTLNLISTADEGYSRNTWCTLNLISTADEGYSRNTLCTLSLISTMKVIPETRCVH